MPFAGSSAPPPSAPSPDGATQTGLWSWSFAGLAAVQFCTSANDNTYRWLVVSIGYALLGPGEEGLVLSIGIACFVAPYILLVAPAAYLADRFSKKRVITLCMLLQVLVLVLGIGSILITNAFLIFATLSLMGVQGALLSPSKGGTIPETILPERISAANGVMGMLTVLAAVIGSVAGNGLYALTEPLGLHRWWISAATVIGTASFGAAGSLLIVYRPAADPLRRPPVRLFSGALRDLRILQSMPPLFAAAAAGAYFWFLAALAQVNVYLLGTTTLQVGQEYIGVLLAMLAVGAAAGSVSAGIWSRDRVEPGLVPIGAAGLALSGILMSTISTGGTSLGYYWSAFFLFTMGFSAGLYDVPLESFLQDRSPGKQLGSVLAASNLLVFSAMLVSSAVFWVLRSGFGNSAIFIFAVMGWMTVPVFFIILWVVGGRTTATVLAVPFRWLASRMLRGPSAD